MAKPIKKAAPKKVAPKRQTPQPIKVSKRMYSGDFVDQLRKEKEEFAKENAYLRNKLDEFAASFLTAQEKARTEEKEQLKPQQAQEPCPKCQILYVLENADLSESQINSVMRDVNNEIQESRMRRANRFTDEARFAQDKAMSFEADCNSHEPYN